MDCATIRLNNVFVDSLKETTQLRQSNTQILQEPFTNITFLTVGFRIFGNPIAAISGTWQRVPQNPPKQESRKKMN
jgi:hypothetical protein